MSNPSDRSKSQGDPERIDYQESSDITEVHASIQREHREPTANVTPIPLWLTTVCGVATVWAGTYFGIFNGGLNGNIYNEYESSPAALFPLPAKSGAGAGAAAAPESLAQIGKSVYGNCVPCHQANGLGVAGQFPPLAAAEWVTGSEKRLVAILLKGMQGPVKVAGKDYNGAMPAWETQLSDKKIAGVVSFIRSSWGNSAPEISEAKVKAARAEFADRKTPWTVAELEQIPADATLPDAGGTAAPAVAAGAAPVAAAAAAPASSQAQVAAGKAVYTLVCAACHQPNGNGLPSVFPPLTKSHYVEGSPERFAAMILKGNAGPMTVAGQNYNNVMPGQEMMLTDQKIADVMTYVRASFGNNAGPISAEVVAAARKKFADRKTPWTQPELDAWKE